MRKPIVAGNWKMNKTVAEARELVGAMSARLNEIAAVEKVLCPPFTSLPSLSEMLSGTDIGVGAQNMLWEEKGAFTGELAPNMVKEFCNYIIIGHSERRTYFGETDETVNKKLRVALKHDLTPIVCIGETLDEYESNRTLLQGASRRTESEDQLVAETEMTFDLLYEAYFETPGKNS